MMNPSPSQSPSPENVLPAAPVLPPIPAAAGYDKANRRRHWEQRLPGLIQIYSLGKRDETEVTVPLACVDADNLADESALMAAVVKPLGWQAELVRAKSLCGSAPTIVPSGIFHLKLTRERER